MKRRVITLKDTTANGKKGNRCLYIENLRVIEYVFRDIL